MEESFGLNWEDATTVVQTEEVVCDMENEILPPGADEFEEVNEVAEEVVETTENEQAAMSDGSIMYLTDGNVIVMQQPTTSQETYQEEDEAVMGVTEEVIAEQWAEGCPEEIIVGSEEAVGDAVEQTSEDCDIPLPTDQDEYTAARPYPCDFCSRRFRKKANLMNHMVAHQTDRPHGCNLCGVRYVRKCDLMNHLKIHAFMPEGDATEQEEMIINTAEFRKKPSKTYVRRKKKRVKDEFDSIDGDEMTASSSKAYSYPEGDMETDSSKREYQEYHMPVVSEEDELRYPVTDPKKPFVCQHCGVGFAREKALASHARIHGGDSPFECQKCGEMFWDISLMRDHIRTKHGDVELYDEDEDDDYTSEQEDTRYGTFYCSTCGLSFHRQDNLRRHQRIHVKEEFVNEVEFGHICNVCGESFPEALDLLAHAEVHARGSEHRCMICGELGPDETSIAIHVQEKHGKTLPPNTCMLCGKTCKDRKTLLKHSWEHSKEKVFSCSECAKTFHNKARLKRHMLSHRSKVVNCDVCGEEFPDGRSLMNHRHSHSNVSGNKFPCRECGKTFGSRSSQQIHIRIHTGERPYGCRFCWKAFADGGTLRKHERIHTGEKPYACAVCPRAFNQRVVLREHIRSHHSGPDPRYSHSMTPYCCAVCSDMFATAQDLILHLIHHCDMNTALKRQPQERPRKYKRRRKLKPHELELISNRLEPDPLVNDEHNMSMVEETLPEDPFSIESEEECVRQKRTVRRPSKKAVSPTSPRPSFSESYQDLYSNVQMAVESIQDTGVAKSPPSKVKGKKPKNDVSMPSRPKMIHTQKTRVPVETSEDGKVRHKTRTLVTRTQPTEFKSAMGERIRPRTKNVSYHILAPEKLPLATFPEDPQEAVDNLLKQTQAEMKTEIVDDPHQQNNGVTYEEAELEQPPEVAAEQTVESDIPVPVGIVQVKRKPRRTNRHVISAVRNVRMIKEGMIVSKIKRLNEGREHQSQNEPESILPDIQPIENIYIKQECKENDGTNRNSVDHQLVHMKQEIMDPSPLHELAEISMHHANSQSFYKCEMCSEVFTDRAQLLVHVPIHI